MPIVLVIALLAILVNGCATATTSTDPSPVRAQERATEMGAGGGGY